MSEFHVEVVKIGEVKKHENADSLSITLVHGGYPVIFRTGEYKEGDLAVYIPVDSTVPTDTPRFSFLEKNRIRAKKLRGTFSMGLLTPAESDWIEGQDVKDILGIKKWQPSKPNNHSGGPGYKVVFGNQRSVDFSSPLYDLHGYRKYSKLITVGEEVVITEKLHGSNGRFIYRNGELVCGSRNHWRKNDENSVWEIVSKKYNLEEKLSKYPNIVFYAEVYGKVQDLTYGATNEDPYMLRFFDAFSIFNYTFYSVTELQQMLQDMDLLGVPVLYRGPWDPEMIPQFAEGNSTLSSHVREGFVIEPIEKRIEHKIGRVKLKFIGEGYYLRGSNDITPDDDPI